MSNDKTPEQQILSHLWWLVLLRGIFLVALGIVFLTRPVVPLTMAILVMGAYWFVDGLLILTKSIRERHTIKHWGFNAFVGVVSIIAGLLVGMGVTFGAGCASGHGVCGLARVSPRSIAATGVFMFVAVATVFVSRHLIGG